MIFKNCSMNDLLEDVQSKALICFGAGRNLLNACTLYSGYSFFEKIDMIADNDSGKKTFSFGEYAKPVYSIQKCLQYAKNEPVILITVVDPSLVRSIVKQLNAIASLHKCNFFVFNLAHNYENIVAHKDASTNHNKQWQSYMNLIKSIEDIEKKQNLLLKSRNTEGKIKVLHFPLRNNRGGISKYILDNWRYIDRDKFVFDFVTFQSNIDFEDELISEGCKIHYVSCLPGKDEARFNWEFNAILDEAYDAVHLHTSRWTGMQMEEIAADRGVPNIIVHSHSSSIGVPAENVTRLKSFTERHEKIRKEFASNWRRYATNLCSCSAEAGKWLFGEELTANEVIILNNSVNIDEYSYNVAIRDRYRKELNLDNCFVIGHVGRFGFPKNHDFIIRMFSGLLQEMPSARLVLVGGDADFERINLLAQEYGIANQTRFLWYRHDVSKLLQAMDVFVLPSIYEGLPIVLIEAQAVGLKCFVSDAVTDEVKISPDLQYIPLDEAVWCSEIIKAAKEAHTRVDKSIMVEDAGYSIKGSVKVLEKLYRGELRTEGTLKYKKEETASIKATTNTMHKCPVCMNELKAFLTAGTPPRPNATCPHCGSFERHRYLWLYIEKFCLLGAKEIKLLHFAPERCYFEAINANSSIDYYPVDINPNFANIRDVVDITNIPYNDGKFDIIICNHVIEHIPDEKKALAELKRVLSSNGTAFISAPVAWHMDVTSENLDFTPEERLKHYGMAEHVRLYGKDYLDRLRAGGFNVEMTLCTELFTLEELFCYGIPEREKIFKCTHAY